MLFFLLPVGCGLFQMAGALPADENPPCRGTVHDRYGEEIPVRHLRPGQTCTTYDGRNPTGTQTFDEAVNLRAQHQSELLLQGVFLTAYGAVGLALVFHGLGLPGRRSPRDLLEEGHRAQAD
ncbi:hypothetical protein CTZ28_29430 [Streptomyces shenzhenensis]|uniref:Uncharacterized protein n=1 Tax=Streptomyces shenzhenensis TaxID=943815 RepID=A0A3M0HZX2_9ACTN|nr:hypothetical protein CTZ28_29430 [Streptomyces shenzhenensis]